MRDYKKYAQDLRRIAQFQNCFECYEGERTEGSCSSYCTLNKAADAIEELHAKVPKQGEWLPHQNAQFIEVDVCSVCGIGTRKMYHCTDGIQTWDEKPFFRYCPWCGAKLSEPPKGVE